MVEIEPKVFGHAKILAYNSKTQSVERKEIKRKKVRGADSELYTSICPVVYVIRIFGLAPYEFYEDALVPSAINSIFSYVCILTYSYIIYNILMHFTGGHENQPILGHTETGKAVCNYFVAIFNLVTTLLSRDRFVKIWNTIQDFDEIVKNMGYARKETKTLIFSWCLLLMNLIMWIAMNQTGILAWNEPWLRNVSYMLIYVGTCTSIIKFSGIAMLLGERFQHLNEIARKNGPSAFRWLISNPIVHIQEIENLHNTLLAASERLNSIYSWSLLFWIGSLSFHLVSDFYFVIQRMMSVSWSLVEWRMLVCLLTWISSFLAQLILLSYACHFASIEANGMGYIMVTWRRWRKNSGFYRGRYESLVTSIHLINRRLDFSAAGCFDVNLPLLRSTAGLMATYLVILLQFPE